MADKLDKSALQTLFEGIRDERRLQANTANRIGNAFLSLLHFCADETSEAYLSRKHDDAAEGVITFLRGLISEQMAQLKAGAQFGDFVSGLYNGKGAQVDANGNAEVESITVRTYMRVMELIVNRLSAQEGDTFFTESDTIEALTVWAMIAMAYSSAPSIVDTSRLSMWATSSRAWSTTSLRQPILALRLITTPHG